MVTYLACFIVCNFEYEEKLTSPEQKDRVKYALDIGANITDHYTHHADFLKTFCAKVPICEGLEYIVLPPFGNDTANAHRLWK